MGAHPDFTLYLRWWWQHHHILPLAVSEGDHISVYQLYIAGSLHQLAIELRAVCALQVDQIRLHFICLISILVDGRLEAELNHCIALA